MTRGVFSEMRAGATGAEEAGQDALEELEFELLAAAASTTTVADDATITAVKMKLNSFCKDSPRLRSQIQALVLSMNRLLGEAYAFATFHILNLHDCGTYPAIDRNFFYRCLVAVSANNSRPATLGPELVNSRDVYHALRPLQGPGSQPVNTVGYAQVLADLSIVMATMAGNHLWENLEKRIFNYLKMKYPGQLMGDPLRKKVVEALVRKPLVCTADLFQLSPSVPPDSAAAERLRHARAVADELRVVLPLPSGDHYQTRAHLTIPLYIKMLQEIEEARAAAAATNLTAGKTINLSNHRTRKWNAETRERVEGLPSARTASIAEYADFVQRYLVLLPELLQHRAAKGYRNMRFLRYVHRQESIHEICEVIAPREGGLVVDIKKHLQKQAHVRLVIIDEYLTSRGCHGCCGTTWNRDVNASKNILLLTMLRLKGYQRPPELSRGHQQ
ncbi:hypothetical protein TSOC_007860 [Tetrabaena socialis]|uniref:Uncharacterized protein n=1 Tax=Tetrabaena socialis TaxID=47790 RepID=A0A2J8A001_9CHLO|nr:hypothetical protein TSOC_007860 [Tetrabaena socialis]|eukprot:PNH05839.1 hypothetical protein TSOC_007860 [Tetrabaena socialis]